MRTKNSKASFARTYVRFNLRPERSYRVSGPSVSESMLGRGGLGSGPIKYLADQMIG